MKFFSKLFSFFKKSKQKIGDVQIKIKEFVQKHKQQIKLFMQILEVVYPAKTGIIKMTNCILFVCGALKLDTEQINLVKSYVEKELQKIYNEFKQEIYS